MSSDTRQHKETSPHNFMGLKIEMDVFQRYYKINEILMRYIGQWPYQSRLTRTIFFTLSVLLFASQCLSLTIAAVIRRHDSEAFVECLPPLIFFFVCLAKLFNYIVNRSKFRTMLDVMTKNWNVWAGDEEIEVFHEYAMIGRKITIVWTVGVYSTAVIYLTQPIVPKILDVLLYNGTEPGEFSYPLYIFGMDEQKYYFYIVAYTYICIPPILMVLVSGDAMFVVHVHHCCGIFAAVGRKLERVKPQNLRRKKHSDSQYLAVCVDRHNEAIEFAELIEKTYSGSYLFVVGLNMIIISVTALQITMNSNEPKDTIRLIVFVGAQMVHLFIESYISQMLIDHSTAIIDFIQNGKWYETSVKSQRLIKLIMMRSIKPCKVTAGKFCVMSIKTFGKVVKTSISYFTLLRSIQ